MQLDIRVPMALMFGILGIILTVYGMMNGSNPEVAQRSLGININLWWGIVMVVFSALMYAWSRMGKDDMVEPKQQPPKDGKRR